MTGDIHALLRARLRGEVLRDEPMARHTSLKVGGPADLFCIPADREDLELLLATLTEQQVPHLVVGGGFNLLVRDGGIRGAVVSLERLKCLEELPGNRVEAEAGVDNGSLVRFAQERGLAGIEFLAGIPGRLGGALSMNAGAHGEAILDRVESLTTLGPEGTKIRSREELEYGYRFLRLPPGQIIVSTSFRLDRGDAAEIEGRIEGFLAHRRNAQRVGFPNAGSFFKNPAGTQAWRLIDEAGLRGCRVGGAQVSEVHTNFLVNRGGATAADFLQLAARIKDEVVLKFGTALEEEVKILGEGL